MKLKALSEHFSSIQYNKQDVDSNKKKKGRRSRKWTIAKHKRTLPRRLCCNVLASPPSPAPTATTVPVTPPPPPSSLLVSPVVVVPSPTSVARLPHPSIRISYQKPLKLFVDNAGSKDDEMVIDNDSKNNSKVNPKVVDFEKQTFVVEIPSRHDYSKTTRVRLWSTKTELKENKRRNLLEYHADGCRWRNCVEESAMPQLECGKRIHPYTFRVMKGYPNTLFLPPNPRRRRRRHKSQRSNAANMAVEQKD